MSISSINAAAAPAPVIRSEATAPVVKAADGDRKVAGPNTSKIKDADGDYKVLSPAALAAAKSSSAVQQVLSNLQKGG